MKKRKIQNMVMAALIVVIAVCGAAAVGSVKGWFSRKQDSFAKVTELVGIVSIERKGISYTLENNQSFMEGDLIKTNADASVKLEAGGNSFAMAENTEIVLNGIGSSALQILITKGEVFASVEDKSGLESIKLGDVVITSDAGVFSYNMQTGSAGVNVFGGQVTVDDGIAASTAKGGECVSISGTDMSVSELQIASLNDFNISQLKGLGEAVQVCFTDEELEKVLSDREQEKIAAVEAGEKSEAQVTPGSTPQEGGDSSNGSTSNTPSPTQGSSSSPSSGQSNGGSSSGSSQGSGSSSGGTTPGSSSPASTPTPGSSSSKPDSTTPGSSNPTSTPTPDNTHKCTIQIVCNTILDNIGDLDPSKKPYVPSDGVILGVSTVEFAEGETVFDVLKRACTRAGIQLEYSYTPMYGSNYVEGINNLYEFDCGQQSGWMYKVNGWFPNYGCSTYKLKNGDAIIWCYTCKGLGADVGGSM